MLKRFWELLAVSCWAMAGCLFGWSLLFECLTWWIVHEPQHTCTRIIILHTASMALLCVSWGSSRMAEQTRK